MLPVQLNKSRAAAARNLYGLPPEQLLGTVAFLSTLIGNKNGKDLNSNQKSRSTKKKAKTSGLISSISG